MAWSCWVFVWFFKMSVSCPCGQTWVWSIAVFHLSHVCLLLLTYRKLLTRWRRKWRSPCSISISQLTHSWAEALLRLPLKGKYCTVTVMTPLWVLFRCLTLFFFFFPPAARIVQELNPSDKAAEKTGSSRSHFYIMFYLKTEIKH